MSHTWGYFEINPRGASHPPPPPPHALVKAVLVTFPCSLLSPSRTFFQDEALVWSAKALDIRLRACETAMGDRAWTKLSAPLIVYCRLVKMAKTSPF
jgi:hypothetical protein